MKEKMQNQVLAELTTKRIIQNSAILKHNFEAIRWKDLNKVNRVDGELQTDFALNSELLKANFPFSRLANKKVNTLIFPNLESANITYKLLKELNKAESIGPIMMGLRKPVHILQLGASVDEIVNMTAVAVVDAQQKGKQ